jgi:hypothetical protein
MLVSARLVKRVLPCVRVVGVRALLALRLFLLHRPVLRLLALVILLPPYQRLLNLNLRH